MKAALIRGKGGPEVLRFEDVVDPQPDKSELRIRVRAFGLNRGDLLQCKGLYPAPPGAPPDIPGLEYAGEVEEVGPHVRRYRVGDRVMGIVGGGAFAEKLCVHEREALPVPSGLDWAQTAAIPEAFLTAYDALWLQGALRPSEHVLIHAVASGVGTAALQLVNAKGAVPIGTSRTVEKLNRCAQWGLIHAIACPDGPTFVPDVQRITQGRGADVALELVGGAYLPQTIDAMGMHGRVLAVGLMGGPQSTVSLGGLLQKRIVLRGTTLRGRPIEEKIALAQSFEREVLPLFANGRLKPVVDAVASIEQLPDALTRLARNETFGKVVVHW